MVTSYTREEYLVVSLILSCNPSIYRKIVDYMGNSYDMGKYNYPWTMPKIKNLLSNWWNSAQTIHIPPTGGLDFSQEQINDEFTGPTNESHGRRQRSGEQDTSTVKCYNYNPYGHHYRNFSNQKLADGEAHVNSRTNDATTTSNSNNENYVPAGSGKSKNMMDAIDLDD